MMRHSMTFIGGVILGAGLVLTAGHMAGFERPVRQAVPTAAQVQHQVPPTGWEDLMAVESRVPKHLQECVGRRYTADSRRHTEVWQRELALTMERAVATCVAMQKPPVNLARK